MKEPLEATPRAAMTTKRKLEVMIALGTCYLCGGKLGKVNEVEFDHIVPLDLGGEDMPGNILPTHAGGISFQLMRNATSKRHATTFA
jgi:hypothetical protein